MSKKNTSAKKIGTILAHIQSWADDLMQFGFNKMKAVAKEKKEDSEDSKTLGKKGKVILKKTARFLGQTGESFYEEYEKLKAEKLDGKKKK